MVTPKFSLLLKRLERIMYKIEHRMVRVAYSYMYIVGKGGTGEYEQPDHALAVPEQMAGHISRLAERYTPVSVEQEGEGGVSTGIEALIEKLRKNVLDKINQFMQRKIRTRFVKWRANSIQAAEKIAERLGDEMEIVEYEALLR